MQPTQWCEWQSQAFWFVLGGGCSSLSVIWQLFRRVRYLRGLLERERAASMRRENELIARTYKERNELQRNLLESFLREPVPTLSELVERTERAFQARASRPPYAASDDETMELSTKDLIPR